MFFIFSYFYKFQQMKPRIVYASLYIHDNIKLLVDDKNILYHYILIMFLLALLEKITKPTFVTKLKKNTTMPENIIISS